MLEGKADVVEACRSRKMKLTEKPANLLEVRLKAEGVLDGMEVRVDVNCISGLPGDSQGSVTFHGNLAQLLSVLSRVWPVPPENREVVSPGRQSWPDQQDKRKERRRTVRSPQHPEGE